TCGRRHPLIRHLFQTWVDYGAPESILFESHPHIGTDNLMRMSIRLRKDLEDHGSEFLFGKRFVGFSPGRHARYVVRFSDQTQIETNHLILAIGHSARETYWQLHASGVAMVAKPYAIGARIEHLQSDINRMQFGNCQIPTAAEY